MEIITSWSKRQIYFLRHFLTENNKNGIISGQSDSHICINKYDVYETKMFDYVLCSPSLRCKKTIDKVSQLGMEWNVIEYDERLYERNMGALEGMRRDFAIKSYPDLFKNGKFIVQCTPPDGETFLDFYERIYSFYNDIIHQKTSGNILICSHNQSLKILYHIIFDLKITQQSWERLKFVNGKCQYINEI